MLKKKQRGLVRADLSVANCKGKTHVDKKFHCRSLLPTKYKIFLSKLYNNLHKHEETFSPIS